MQALDGFLSTPSARRATLAALCRHRLYTNFYPRPPRGGRHAGIRDVTQWLIISIHALREEDDSEQCCTHQRNANFYPRPPRGGRPFFFTGCSPRFAFLSTPSARRTTYMGIPTGVAGLFLSTPSARRTTSEWAAERKAQQKFLSTPSARRTTMPAITAGIGAADFYPRPPRGGRP